MLTPDFREFVELLIKHKVEYLIAGGYAVGIYGHPRYTGDLDIWLNRTEENAIKIIATVKEFGFQSFNLSPQDFLKKENVIQLGYPPLRIDLLTDLDGVSFSECFANKIEVELEGLKVNFIGYADLIKNKTSTGRPIDLDDIENMKE
jgi:hypothetical protein